MSAYSISPLGYYRLGQSYPRLTLREEYKQKWLKRKEFTEPQTTMQAVHRGSGTNTTSATTFVINLSENARYGSFIVLLVSADNSHTNGAAHTTFTATDTLGNAWTRRVTPTYDPGLVNAGVTGAIFTTPMNGGVLQKTTNITVTFNTATVNKCWTLYEVFPSNPLTKTIYYISGNVNTGSVSAAPTVTTTSIAINDLVIAGLHNEYGTTQVVTSDRDSLNGNWTDRILASVGTTDTGMTLASQTKIQRTAASTQVFNPTLGTSSDVILSWIQLREQNIGGGILPLITRRSTIRAMLRR